MLFVAMLPPLNRPLCVLTNAVVRGARPTGPGSVGLNPYGGVLAERMGPVMSGWPGQLLPGGGGRTGGLPGDGELGEFELLLPLAAPGLQGADVVVDDFGRRFVVGAVALTELGWRISLRHVGT